MTEPTLDALAQRLDRLERKVRWWRVFAGGTAVTLALLAVWGVGRGANPASAAAPRVIEAERFVLRDAAGRSRVVLEVTATGSTGLSLRDEHEITRLSFLVATEGPTVTLNGEKGKPRVMLYAPADGWGLDLWREDGKRVASLGFLPGRGSLLNLDDETGTTSLAAGQGIAALKLDNQRGEVTLSANQQYPGLQIRGKAQDNMGTAWMTFNGGDPVLYLRDRFQQTRIILGSVPRTTGDVWGLNVQDTNGKTLWAVP
jgi:hypothetical protein